MRSIAPVPGSAATRGHRRTTARMLAVIVVATILAGCGGSTKKTTATTNPGRVTIGVTIKDGKPVGGIQRATATKGDTVAIVVHSDVADEVHVHGYDLHKDVGAGGSVRIGFRANLVGVFEAELESRSLQIVELTVKP
jgi:hypothetical protein